MDVYSQDKLLNFINSIYPCFLIKDIAKKSGQRSVYIGVFTENQKNNYHTLGDVVIKISELKYRSQISYLQKEIEILNSIKHVSYPRVFMSDAITSDPNTNEPLDNLLFISVEEKKEGVPLSNKMRLYDSAVKVRTFLEKIILILDVLWLHPNRIVHRDLKPDNILITDSGDISIIDLGILREAGSEGVTLTGMPFGPCTPLYSSPEQAINDKENISFKSDMFSLGIIAYEMLSNKNPFLADDSSLNDVGSILERICTYIPPDLHAVYGISKPLSETIHKMLEKQPYKRFRTSKSLLENLNRYEL